MLSKSDVLSMSKNFLDLMATANDKRDIYCKIYDTDDTEKEYRSLVKHSRHCKAADMKQSKASLLVMNSNENSFSVTGPRAVATVCSPVSHSHRVIFASTVLICVLIFICFVMRCQRSTAVR